jgi:flagellar L-ring protein precursor FlgH
MLRYDRGTKFLEDSFMSLLGISLRKQLKGRASLSVLLPLMLVIAVAPAQARKKRKPQQESLSEYLQQVNQETGSPYHPTAGSLWNPDVSFGKLSRDDKALNVGDLVTIDVVELTTSSATGTAKTQRTFSANSGISQFLGPIGPRSGLQNLFAPNSQEALSGQAQTATSYQLNTSLTGRVVATLPNGYLVVEGHRRINNGNQSQLVTLRGVVRPDDVSTDNVILSSQMSNLELEVNGKGIINEGTREPNVIIRTLLHILNF